MKRIKDERLIKESDLIGSKMYWFIMILLLIELILKFQYTRKFEHFLLEILCIISTNLYIIINFAMKGILFRNSVDEYIVENRRKVISRSYLICTSILLFGGFILMLLFPDNLELYAVYLPVYLIPAFIYTIYSVKNGLLIRSSSSSKKETKRKNSIVIIISSIIYGILTEGHRLFTYGTFHPEAILTILIMGFSWGILYYFFMKLLVQKSTKIADKKLHMIQEGDDCQDEK